MQASDFTDTQMRSVARIALRAYLDTAAGLPPGRWGGRLLHTVDTDAADPRAEPVPHARLGPVTVLRYRPDRAYVAAAIDTGTGTPYGLIAAELAIEGGRWRAANVACIDGPAHRVRDADRWALEPDVPQHLQGLLGPLPTDEDARAKWALAAAVVTDYRETWGIDDPHSALGKAPDDPDQRRERERALALTRQLVRAMDQIEPTRDIAREELGPRDQGRGGLAR